MGLMGTHAFAAVTVTPPTATTTVATNSATGTGAYTQLADITLVGSAVGDFVGGATCTFTAPAGFEFNTASTATGTGPAGVTAVAVTFPSATTMQVAITGTSTAAGNVVLSLSAGALDFRPTANSAASGSITTATNTCAPSLTLGTAVESLSATGAATAAPTYNILMDVIPASATCTNVLAAPSPDDTPTLPADGSQAATICAYVTQTTTGGVTTAASGIPVTFTVSLGVVSTGTAKTVTVITTTAGIATTAYRGGGNTASTDTVVASYSAGNAVATDSVPLVTASGRTASKIVIQSPQTLAICANITNTTPNYQCPTTGANVSIQVQDASGLGVDGQVLLISVDRGALVLNPNFATAVATVCSGVTAKSITATTSSQPQSAGGTAVSGVADVTVCGNQTDAPGKITLTAQNITTSMANATTTLSMAGRPSKIAATATGNSITATVTDAAGNNVADGTPVRFTISSNAGAVSTTCSTTTNGQATSVVALNAATGTVIVSTDWNETGPVASCAVGGNGSQQLAASVTVPGGTSTGGTGGTQTGTCSITSGSIPAAGGFGLIVAQGQVSCVATATGCPVSSMALWATVNGNFVTYVPGTTISAVNADFLAAFPGGVLPPATPLIGKCK